VGLNSMQRLSCTKYVFSDSLQRPKETPIMVRALELSSGPFNSLDQSNLEKSLVSRPFNILEAAQCSVSDSSLYVQHVSEHLNTPRVHEDLFL